MELREIGIRLVTSSDRNYFSAVPSSTYLGRMYDNNCTKLTITHDEDFMDYDEIRLLFRNNRCSLGAVALIEKEFLISSYYTGDKDLSVQVILVKGDSEIRSNIIEFKLNNSIKVNDKDQGLSYLNRLVLDGRLNLRVDGDNLIMSDSLGNDLLTYNLQSSFSERIIKDSSPVLISDGRVIELKVVNSMAKIISNTNIISKSNKYFKLKFNFDPSWDQFTEKVAVFYQTKSTDDPVRVPVIDDEVVIPSDNLASGDYLYISVLGMDGDDNVRMTTNSVYLYVIYGN